ncbi:MAG: NmrA/HSCARG family protein [Bacteroidota bacterium]|nr:NmrA/HSCARG family protein [Bacteroidota bacterium]
MAEKKIIAVVGATGSQGSGLVQSILRNADSPFAVRAITRDPNSEKARALAAQGAEVVAANVEDRASLKAAFKGAYGAYCVTFFWEHFSPEKEKEHARNLAEAAREAGVKHVIWSTLEDTRRWVPLEDDRMPTLMEKYKVPHFDAKGEADDIFREAGVPTTFLLTSFYWDNAIFFGIGPKKGEDGSLHFTIPMGDAKLPGIASEDIGKCAYGIFNAGDEFIGKTIGIAGEHLSGTEMAEKFGQAIGEPVAYNAVPPEVYRGFGFPGADDLGNMFQFKHDFETDFRAARSVSFTRTLNPELQSFDRWLEKNAAKISLE